MSQLKRYFEWWVIDPEAEVVTELSDYPPSEEAELFGHSLVVEVEAPHVDLLTFRPEVVIVEPSDWYFGSSLELKFLHQHEFGRLPHPEDASFVSLGFKFPSHIEGAPSKLHGFGLPFHAKGMPYTFRLNIHLMQWKLSEVLYPRERLRGLLLVGFFHYLKLDFHDSFLPYLV